MKNKKNLISALILLGGIPVIMAVGFLLFGGKQYAFISAGVAVLSCVPFFMSFERNSDNNSVKLVIIAVMTALSVTGRVLFSMLYGIKPVTAIIIITAIYLGSETGFMVGSVTALVSNFFFGQGIWTPFQMFTWGLIGFIAGIISEKLKHNRLLLYAYGALSGIAYSLIIDIWSVLWNYGEFDASKYPVLISSSLVFTLIYAVSNVIFLMLLAKPIGSKLERITIKYGI